MMTQEEFMDVLAMRRQGMTYTEIADETGYFGGRLRGETNGH